MLFDYQRIKEWIPYISEGLGVTLLIALVASVFGLLIGVIIVLMSKSKKTAWFSKGYLDIFRGTPVLLQLAFIYFAIPQIADRLFNDMWHFDFIIQMTALVAAFLTFSLNSGAYISEIIRSGIQSVDAGEIEAAKALGVSKFNIYQDIIFPNAFRNIFPALMNELVTLVKESSIVSVIGIQDLMRRQQIVSSQTYMFFEPLIIVGIIYYLVIKILSFIGRKIERKLAYD